MRVISTFSTKLFVKKSASNLIATLTVLVKAPPLPPTTSKGLLKSPLYRNLKSFCKKKGPVKNKTSHVVSVKILTKYLSASV